MLLKKLPVLVVLWTLSLKLHLQLVKMAAGVNLSSSLYIVIYNEKLGEPRNLGCVFYDIGVIGNDN